MKSHHYRIGMKWTGNLGAGTTDYKAYSRNHVYLASGKPALAGSSDPAFRGDPSRHNPEELLVGALSSCHMLWYLHFCAVHGVIVTAYEDEPEGVMDEEPTGAGQFRAVTLRPRVTVTAASQLEKARSLHEEAHAFCFLARSMNFPVSIEASVTADS